MLVPDLSHKESSLEAAYEWYKTQQDALDLYKKNALNAKNPDFRGMPDVEVKQYFIKLNYELGMIACLAIHAAAEAALIVDFSIRAKDGVRWPNREIRALLKTGDKAGRLDFTQVLSTWKKLLGNCSSGLNTWNMHRECRHWLAHGRYYSCPTLKKGYDPTYVYKLCKSALNCLGKAVPGEVTHWKK